MRNHALSTTTAATALVATAFLGGGAALADNNCPPPKITGANGGGAANAGTNGTSGGSAGTSGTANGSAGSSDTGGIAGSTGPNTGSAGDAADTNGAASANGGANSNGGSTDGSAGGATNGSANGSSDANGSAGGGAAVSPSQVAWAHRDHGGPATLLIDCGDRAKVRPDQYTLACNDGTNYLSGLRWTYWSRNSARATGLQYANDCTPDCAHGTFHAYSAIITVSQRHRLPHYRSVTYFSHMRLDYGTPRPGDLDHQDYTLTP